MKAEELRIGNYITSSRQYFKEPVIGVVYQVSNAGICFEYDEQGEMRGISNPLKHILPIHLTEEWLIKFGFRKIETEFSSFFAKEWGTNGVEIVKWSKTYNAFMYELCQSKDKHIEYCHQLQNLFFALSGEEITISEPTKQSEG